MASSNDTRIVNLCETFPAVLSMLAYIRMNVPVWKDLDRYSAYSNAICVIRRADPVQFNQLFPFDTLASDTPYGASVRSILVENLRLIYTGTLKECVYNCSTLFAEFQRLPWPVQNSLFRFKDEREHLADVLEIPDKYLNAFKSFTLLSGFWLLYYNENW